MMGVDALTPWLVYVGVGVVGVLLIAWSYYWHEDVRDIFDEEKGSDDDQG